MNTSRQNSTSEVPNLRGARLVYAAVWLFVALGAALFEAEIFPTGCLSVDAESMYAFQVISVAFVLIVPWVSLKWFRFAFVRKALIAHPEHRNRWNLYRIALMAAFLFFNLALYYALLSTTTPLFCLLIGLIAYVFCAPKRAE